MRKKFTTTLDKQWVTQLKIQAAKEQRSAGEIIEDLVRKYLAKKN